MVFQARCCVSTRYASIFAGTARRVQRLRLVATINSAANSRADNNAVDVVRDCVLSIGWLGDLFELVIHLLQLLMQLLQFDQFQLQFPRATTPPVDTLPAVDCARRFLPGLPHATHVAQGATLAHAG